jgi:predicted nucleic acid-binding protein
MATTEPGGSVVVSDAGPLIHLDELDCLDLLSDFGQVLVPRRVWVEVTKHRPRLQFSQVPQGVIVDPPEGPSPQLVSLGTALGLGAGEMDALAILGERIGLLLCDDAAARLAAESLGFTARGTLGLLVRSIRQGRRRRAKALAILVELPIRSTLHVSKPLLQSVIDAVERQG